MEALRTNRFQHKYYLHSRYTTNLVDESHGGVSSLSSSRRRLRLGLFTGNFVYPQRQRERAISEKKSQPEETQCARSRLSYIISFLYLARVLAVIEPFDLASRYLKPQREYLPTYLRKRLYLDRHMRLVRSRRVHHLSNIFVPEGRFLSLPLNSARRDNCVIFFSRASSVLRLRFHSKIHWPIFAYRA